MLIETKRGSEKNETSKEEIQLYVALIFGMYGKDMFTLSDILKRGGNAADAAVAMAAALAVTEPCSTGPGGDAFCLFYNGNSAEIRGINGRLELLCLSECAYYSHNPLLSHTSVFSVVDRLALRLLTLWKDVATQLRLHLHLFMP